MLVEFKKNFKLICDKSIAKIPIKKILNLWNFKKYFDFGSMTKLAAISAAMKV